LTAIGGCHHFAAVPNDIASQFVAKKDSKIARFSYPERIEDLAVSFHAPMIASVAGDRNRGSASID